MVQQRLPAVNGDDGAWGDILNQWLTKEHFDDGLVGGNSLNGMHKTVTIVAGTATALTAPLKFNTGSLLAAAEAGAVEFNTDKLYYTTTTPTRKTIAAYDTSGGATGDVYYRDVSGNFFRLPIGSTNDVLTVASGVPSWAPAPGGGSGLTHPQVMARVSMGF